MTVDTKSSQCVTSRVDKNKFPPGQIVVRLKNIEDEEKIVGEKKAKRMG